MNKIKTMWWIALIISAIWLVVNILSIVNYTLINTFEVIHAKRDFGETAEILKREKEVVGLVKMFIFLALTNVFLIILSIISIRKFRTK
tara:strand:+ start:838 stop:1104 length:267 start_codon:yes stop_codon:yes gene_type:complete